MNGINISISIVFQWMTTALVYFNIHISSQTRETRIQWHRTNLCKKNLNLGGKKQCLSTWEISEMYVIIKVNFPSE